MRHDLRWSYHKTVKKKTRFRVGGKLRAVRERKGITLKQVAAEAGVTESLISQVERNQVSPSIDTLLSIVDVLEIDLEYLLSDYRKSKPVSIVRESDRSVRKMQGVSYYQLSAMTDSVEEYGIEAVMLKIEPGAVRGSPEYGHPGKELGVILAGKGELSYGTEIYPLCKDDSVSFESGMPHSMRNTGTDTLIAIWVNTPPRMLFR